MPIVSKQCGVCNGTGWYWGVPLGFNPFSAGATATARAMQRYKCAFCEAADQKEVDDANSR